MKKRTQNRLVVVFALSILGLTACSHTVTQVHYFPEDSKTIENASNSIVKKLGLQAHPTSDSIQTYVRKSGRHNVFLFRTLALPYNDDSSKVTITTVSQYESVAKNLNVAINSFLDQELHPDIVNQNQGRFYKPNSKSKSEFQQKTWVNLGYGINYVGKENPFVSKSDNTIGTVFFGLFDLAHIALIIGGPFIGETKEDKITISLVGLGSLIVWKLLLPTLQSNRDIEEYNNIANSDYFLPIELKK